MKTKIEIDATPEEWRRFFGMPDVGEIHAEIMRQVKDKIGSGEYDPMALMQQLMPDNLQELGAMQQKFWENLFEKK